MTARTLMVQGTGSSVGKSLLVTALCRILRQDGYEVAPFKAQNMSLNSHVTPGGAEIGRSQAVQAEAAGVLPVAEMNPILLKPEVDYRSQLVVLGRPVGFLESRNFNRRKEGLWDTVVESLDMLRSQYDVVVIEGAGSPAEINLRQGDIVNMEVALYAGAPVLLAADIDKGGVFASVYGTILLLAPAERELVKGVVINKFRGDVTILKPGLTKLEELTGVPVMGVVPYFRGIYIPEEDSPSTHNTLQQPGDEALLDVAVLALPHIANFDDFDPLKRETGVNVRYVRTVDEMGTPDLLVIPGTKTTVADLVHLQKTGLAARIRSLSGQSTAIIGICGGYQMLGRAIRDHQRVESDRGSIPGFDLLPVVTDFSADKRTHLVNGTVEANLGLLEGSEGLSLNGYEIHMGTSIVERPNQEVGPPQPFRLSRRSGSETDIADGCLSQDGWVMGTYVHGLFLNAALRRAILAAVAARKGVKLRFGEDAFDQSREYDKLADHVRSSLDMDVLYRVTGLA